MPLSRKYHADWHQAKISHAKIKIFISKPKICHAFCNLPLPVSQSMGIVITSPGERGEPVIEVSPRLGFIVITEINNIFNTD